MWPETMAPCGSFGNRPLTADARSLVASYAGWRMVTFKDGEMRVVRQPAVASSDVSTASEFPIPG